MAEENGNPLQGVGVGLPSNFTDYRFRGDSGSLTSRMEYISLEELESMGSEPRSTMRSVFVGVVLYLKRMTNDNKKGVYSRVSQTKDQDRNFDRTMTVMDLNSSAGRNTAVILLNSANSDRIFGQFISGRDTCGGFGPGAIIVITRPSPVDNYFGDNALRGLPVLKFSGGLRLVDRDAMRFSISRIPFQSTGTRLHGFYYPRVRLHLLNLNLGHSTCCGFLCDSIGLKKSDGSNDWHRSCACYSTQQQLGQVLLDLSLRIVVLDDKGEPTGESFYSHDFTSRAFTYLMTVSGFPGNVNTTHLESNGDDGLIVDEVEKILDYVNRKLDGFHVLGWARRGFVKDASADTDTSDKKKEVPKVASGTVTHHVTNVGINGDSTRIKDLLIDVNKLLGTHSH